MERLEIKLLGTFKARLDGEVLTGFRSDKTRALLAYLAVENTRPHRRDWLAALLWGNYNDRAARRSLSSALANLRQLLSPLGSFATLDASRSDVWLQTSPDLATVDVTRLRELLSWTASHAHRSLIYCDACSERLAQATDIYTGSFLPGMTFGDCPAFDEWQRTQQETLHQQVLEALDTLTLRHLAAAHFGQAETFARRQLSLQPWHESAHRQLMLALASSGQRNAALAQYDLCQTILAADLGVEPEPETVALYQRIRSGMPLPVVAVADSTLSNPYHGLQSFREADTGDFFGRETITRELVDTVQRRSLSALIGPSGSGKSSVLHAGLIHRLRGVNAFGQTTSARSGKAAPWAVCEVRLGSHPFHALAAAIVPYIKPGQRVRPRDEAPGADDLARMLASGDTSLAQLLNGNGDSANGRRLLLVLDQFEELYTLCNDAEQRRIFIDLLLDASSAASGSAPCSVLLALRADFMGQVLAHRGLADALHGGVLMLGPMNRQELEEVIVKPAQAQGVRLQDGLAARILRDVGQAPGRLPLLEFALTQLWANQMNGVLTHDAYEAIGQVEGALADYADGVYALLSASEQAAARRLFTQMVQLGQDTEDSRRPLTAAEVSDEDWALVQRLAGQRLLVTDIDVHGQQTAEIVHEALIHGWGRLRRWLDADRAFHLWQQRARLAADQWQDSQRDPGALLRGAPLAEAGGWYDARASEIGQRVSEFIAASQAQRRQEEAEATARQQATLAQARALADAEHQRAEVEKQANRRLRWFSASLALVTVAAIVAGLIAFLQGNEAERQSARAQVAQATADAGRVQAEQEAVLAKARQLGAQSINLSGTAPDLSNLLAVHALSLNRNGEENTELLLNLKLSPLLDAVLHDQDSSVYNFAISPDSRILASSGENGAIWLWDLATRQLQTPPLQGHEQAVQTLAFSPDGARLASGDRNGVIRLWDARNGQPVGDPIQAHADTISALSFSADGQTLLSSSDQGIQRAWNVATGAPIGPEIILAGVDPNAMAYSPDGSLLAAKDGLTLTVQSALDGQLISPPMIGHSATIHDVAFSPDGRFMASAGFDGIVTVWDVTTGQALYPPLEGHDGRVLAVVWSPDGKIIASGGTDAQIILWDAATGLRIGPPLLGHGNWVRALAWTPDGSTLISGDAVGKVDLWASGNLHWLSGHTATVRGVDFSPDGSTLASGSFDTTVLLHDIANGQQRLSPLQGHDNAVLNVAYSPDGRMLVSASAGGDLVRWSAAAGQPLGEPLTGHTAPVAGLAISPDGRTIASGSFDNTIRLWDAATGEPLGEPLKGHSNWIISLAFSPDGRTLASGSSDTTIRLWDVATGAAIGEPLPGHTGWVTDLTWSPDGASLVSGSLDKTIRFWDAATGRPNGEPLDGHEAGVWSVMLNPADGGRTMVTGDNSGTVIWWDVASRQALAPPLRTAIENESMALSPDGRTIAIGSFGSDALVSLWRLPAGPWDEDACAVANRELTDAERDYYFGDFDYEAICNRPAADQQ